MIIGLTSLELIDITKDLFASSVVFCRAFVSSSLFLPLV